MSNFPQIAQQYLGHLPKDNYPQLDIFKFVSIWLSFVVDQSQTSMRSLFKRLDGDQCPGRMLRTRAGLIGPKQNSIHRLS